MKGRFEVQLSRHAPSWDSDAAAAIASLRHILNGHAVEIRHIGSTAVRGILAVPVIDIAVGLTATANVQAVLAMLRRSGYMSIPTDATGCIRAARLKRDRSGDHVRLWITRAGSRAWQELNTFRDYLNNHVFAANEYEELKQTLAEKYRDDPAAYSAAKSDFIRSILRLSVTDPLLGRHLTIVIDRPLGSRHPEHPELEYKLNYGFVPGITAPDGEELDAYIYGVNRPMHRFTGTVIGVVHRRNDAEDKLIVAPSGMIAYEPQLTEAVHFQEQYFDTSIICIYEKSCGGIIYRVRGNMIEYLTLYQHRSGTWSVPKGHIAAGETEHETALREIYEETGLRVSLIDGFRREMSYTVSAKASKNVVIFLAEAQGELALGENEISDCLWLEKSAAIRRLGGRSIGRIIESAEQFIRTRLLGSTSKR